MLTDRCVNQSVLHRNLQLIAGLAALLLLVWWWPTPPALRGIADYLPMHTAMETLAIVVAMLVFGATWNTYREDRAGNINLLGCAMLAVGLIDFAHMLSFHGMPDFVTPSHPAKAINFWLIARLLMALAMLGVAALPRFRLTSPRSHYVLLAAALLLTALIYWIGLFHAEALPDTFIPGQGLTPFKIAAEWLIIAILLVSALIFFRQAQRETEPVAANLFTAVAVSILSELCFTIYKDVADIFNLLGHVYKVIAYLYLYRAVFVETVRAPYRRLSETQAVLLDDQGTLRQTLKTLETVANASPVLLWSSGLNKGCDWFNRRWLEFTGRTMEQELGDGWAESVHPDDIAHCLSIYVNSFDARQSFSMEYRLRRQDGEYRWLLDQGLPRYDADGEFIGYIGSCLDVTESKRQEQALHESEVRFRTTLELRVAERTAELERTNAALQASEEKFRSAFANAAIAFAMTTPDGRFVDANPAYSLLTGYSIGELRTLEFVRLIHPDDLAENLKLNERMYGGEVAGFVIENRYMRKDGETVWVRKSVSLVRDSEGLPRWVIALVEDISERQRMLAALAQAKETAERANQAKSLFLANMSHEIRTPMNAIIGMAELGLAADPDEKQRNYLSKIRSASDALLHIINDILDFSKVEADRLDLVKEPFTLAAVFDGLTSLLTRKAREKGLTLAIQAAPDLLARTFLGDPLRLRQILINLTGNAIKFSQHGDVALSVVEENPTDDAAKEFSTLHFAVCDEGIGIAADDQARLFQPFSQADASTTRTYGGTGLGLAISRRLVELMGGWIWVNSAPGQGSTFHFTARFAPGDPATLPVHDRRRMDRAALTLLRGAEILVVEDAELNQEVMCALLEQAGLRVRLATNGEEALRAVAAALPDGVLMDCQMPVMDGYEATRRLRAQERCRDLPIIALTANAMAGDRELCLAAGMNDFVPKPVDFRELSAVLVQWVQPRSEAGFGPLAAETAPDPLALTLSPSGGAETEYLSPILLELPGIDPAAGLTRVGGRTSFYLKQLTRFRDSQAGDFLAQFRAAQQVGDGVTATRLAHTLKSIARTLGASRLGNLAAQLEDATRQGSPQTVAEGLDALNPELDRVLAGLAGLGGSAPALPGPCPGPADLEALFGELDQLLDEQDIAAIDCMARFSQALAGGEHHAEAEAISRAIAHYAFADAQARLRRLALALHLSADGSDPE